MILFHILLVLVSLYTATFFHILLVLGSLCTAIICHHLLVLLPCISTLYYRSIACVGFIIHCYSPSSTACFDLIPWSHTLQQLLIPCCLLWSTYTLQHFLVPCFFLVYLLTETLPCTFFVLVYLHPAPFCRTLLVFFYLHTATFSRT